MFLTFEGIENVRDLGGLVRPGGARVKSGLLLRSGKLSGATDGDIRRLADMGLFAVVDFRDKAERDRDPDREVPGAACYCLPALPDLSALFDSPEDEGFTAAQAHRDFRELYRYLALSPEAHEAYTRFFRILLASEGRPVLWHCTQGKDRTGVAAMLLLTALGFEEDAAVEEYLLTNDYMGKRLEAYAASGVSEAQAALAREVLLVFRENARFYLDCLQIEYGSVMNFVELALGIGPDEAETLERYYLE